MAITTRVAWFGYTCWDIWTSRCRRVFDMEQHEEQPHTRSSFLRAAWDTDLLKQCKFIDHNHHLRSPYQAQTENCTRLETDGSVLASGASSGGGLIRDQSGGWIGGFACKLSIVPPTIAELCAIIHGLHLCRQKRLTRVEICTDSIEVIDLLFRGCPPDYPYTDLVTEARTLIMQNWEVFLHHVRSTLKLIS